MAASFEFTRGFSFCVSECILGVWEELFGMYNFTVSDADAMH